MKDNAEKRRHEIVAEKLENGRNEGKIENARIYI